MDQKVELLSKVPLLAGLSRKDLEQVAQISDEVDLPAGRVLMKQGSYGSEFFVIISGNVRVERDGQVLRELGPGDFLGELALLDEIGLAMKDASICGLGQTAYSAVESAIKRLRLFDGSAR